MDSAITKKATATSPGTKSRTRLITLHVNGETHEIAAKPSHMLVEVIRDQIGLTGTKSGCSSGACGACTL
ncbi:MAG: 2Fe-2S iron-sulfur cluster binding domain-containing protein, partial [Fimbriimonadaceae bacterium]|nr:2Fe-2S iron-sulfur cluster binding domain-containing protein [Alphaproteobacteria bacterium]